VQGTAAEERSKKGGKRNHDYGGMNGAKKKGEALKEGGPLRWGDSKLYPSFPILCSTNKKTGEKGDHPLKK